MPESAVGELRRPFLAASMWVPLLLVVLACAGIAFEAHQLVQAARASAFAAARAEGRVTESEIVNQIRRERERLAAFVEDKQSEIDKIARMPDDWPAIDELQVSMQSLFSDALAFTVTDAHGTPLFEDFEGLAGPVCQASMRRYAQHKRDGQQDPDIPAIHPTPDAYHFDLITPVGFADGGWGLFFVSMRPTRIAELLAAGEASSGNRLLLVNRADPSLIEVTAAGARDRLGDETRLDSDTLDSGHFASDVQGTSWRLLALPDEQALVAAVRRVIVNAAWLIGGVLAISIVLLYLIRRAERRNSTVFMRSLQSTVSRQRAILQSMVDGMVTIDAQGIILNVNQAVTQLFGYRPGELVGSNVNVLMSDADHPRHDDYLANYLETGESKILGKGREVTARHKSGRLFPVWLTLGESKVGDEHIFVGILHDMSAYREAQRQIAKQQLTIQRTAQELEAIGEVASRDLQQPLERIASLGAALGAGTQDLLSQTDKAQLRNLTDEVQDISDLVKGLADFTQAKPENALRRVSLDDLVTSVCQDFKDRMDAAGASVEIGELGWVTGDEKQLRQVVWNLLDNALKFVGDEPPRIVIDADAGGSAPRGDRPGGPVLRIRDNGIGIPAGQLETVFEAFRRLHPRDRFPGMGLGLSFCRKIVQDMGCDIRISSTLGEGTTVEVELPRPEAVDGTG